MNNKGEWSEVYVFARLLADGRVDLADNHARRIPVSSQKIKNIVRDGIRYSFDYDPSYGQKKYVEIHEPGKDIVSVEAATFPKFADDIFDGINRGSGTFDIERGQMFLDLLHQRSVSAPSTNKTDIEIEFDNGGPAGLQGYSIKSYLGSNPTLWNASNSTKIEYEIQGMQDRYLDEINAARDPMGAFRSFFMEDSYYKVQLIYEKYLSSQCEKNFVLIDANFPRIMAECIKQLYLNPNLHRCDEVIAKLEKDDFLDINVPGYYEKKFKDFLEYAAFGMVPSKQWAGTTPTNGGFLLVKKNGSILCYQYSDKDAVRQYLFNHVIFDTPSTKKYCTRDDPHVDRLPFKSGDKYFMRLNYQVRYCDEE